MQSFVLRGEGRRTEGRGRRIEGRGRRIRGGGTADTIMHISLNITGVFGQCSVTQPHRKWKIGPWLPTWVSPSCSSVPGVPLKPLGRQLSPDATTQVWVLCPASPERAIYTFIKAFILLSLA